MMRTLTLLFIIAFVALSFKDIPPFTETVVSKFNARIGKFPREKVYLHTDKDIYRAGEDIWMRAYLTNAATNEPFAPSRYIYVELTDRRDSLVRRIKLMETDSVFHGNLKLADNILQGDYCLRAFTYWMQNDGAGYLFQKNIRVLNPKESKLNTEVTYTPGQDDALTATIRVSDAQKSILANHLLHYEINRNGKTGNKRSVKTDEQGMITLKLQPGSQSIHLYHKNDIPFEFDRYLYIPEVSDDFEVQFFPEGGNLLSGTLQRIAFKAIGKDGMSRDVSGMVYIDTIPVAPVVTRHKGMGTFTIPVNTGQQYTARIKNANGLEKTFTLPAQSENGLGIQLTPTDTTIQVRLLKAKSTRFPKPLYLILQNRGQILSVLPVRNLQQTIAKEGIPEGISHLTVMDEDYKVYSQRIFFVYPAQFPGFTMTTDKTAYKNREKVEVELSSLSGELEGSFSVSVSDSAALTPNTWSQNTILSSLLLTSDLKGYIEEPAYYFDQVTEKTEEDMDLVMLTHGWTRFNLEEIADEKPVKMPYYLERGQTISGKVENYWEKDAAGAQLMIIGDNGYAGITFTDETGRFMDDQVAFADSTRFIIRALNHKGNQRVVIQIDKEEFLPISNYFPYNPEIKEQDDDFYKKFYQNFYYENGVKVYVLNEVNVTRKAPPKKYSRYDNWVDDYQRLDSARIAAIDETDILKIIDHVPGVMVVGRQVLKDGEYKMETPKNGNDIKDSQIPIYVNGFEETSITFVEWLQKKDLLGISLLKGSIAKSVFGKDTVLLITTVPGHQLMKPRLVLNVVRVRPLGVHIPDEFYVPRYDVDSVRHNELTDDRSTLYWNPDVRLKGKEPVKLSFYTADTKGKYVITLEGITREGVICRKSVSMSTID